MRTKLASRKFWALLAALATAVLTAFGVADNDIVQITGIIGAFGAIIVYILAEASVDKARAGNGDDAAATDDVAA